METVAVRTRRAWRAWLRENHARSDGVWLVFGKKRTAEPSLSYEEAVEEALCFGWIDSILRSIDARTYARMMTPRRPGSRWSEANRRRIARLEAAGRLEPAGRARVEEARASGRWDEPGRPEAPADAPADLKEALASNGKAARFFEQLAPSYRRQYVGWISAARRRDTRQRRIEEAVALLEQGRKLGMK